MPNEIQHLNIDTNNYIIKFAQTTTEIDGAKYLRYKYYKNKLNQTNKNLDEDKYDEFCHHLIVVDKQDLSIIGTYRLMTSQKANNGIGFIIENQYQTLKLQQLPGSILEVGRACVDERYRASCVINWLWHGLTATLVDGEFDYFLGISSVELKDIDQACAIYNFFKQEKLYKKNDLDLVIPHQENEINLNKKIIPLTFNQLPGLLKGYLRLGCKLIGPPSIDNELLTIDFPILVAKKEIALRYLKHFSHYAKKSCIK